MQDNLRSPHEYRANGTIAAMVQEFFAATIGGYREFIKSPAQQTPQRPPTAAARLSKLRSRISEARMTPERSGDIDVPPERSSGSLGEKAGSGGVYMDDQIIQGTSGYRYGGTAAPFAPLIVR